MGECESDDECMGGLVCGDTPTSLPVPEYRDQLPLYPHTSGIIQCDEYCHSMCCQFPDNIVACPEVRIVRMFACVLYIVLQPESFAYVCNLFVKDM